MYIIKELFPYKQCNKYHFRYFVSFVEEGIMNPKYQGYTGGRCEVIINEERYAIDEYRFLTNKKSFYKFVDLVDFKHYNVIGLWIIKLILKYYYKHKVI